LSRAGRSGPVAGSGSGGVGGGARIGQTEPGRQPPRVRAVEIPVPRVRWLAEGRYRRMADPASATMLGLRHRSALGRSVRNRYLRGSARSINHFEQLRGRSSAGRALDWQSRGSRVRVPSPPLEIPGHGEDGPFCISRASYVILAGPIRVTGCTSRPSARPSQLDSRIRFLPIMALPVRRTVIERTPGAAEAVVMSLILFREWPQAPVGWSVQFMLDSEWNWLDGEPPIDDL
jgi:hypothetical protein